MARAGTGSRGRSSAYSRQVVANIERLRVQLGLTNAQIMAAAGLSKNYFYIRLRYEAPFTTDDVAAIASALNVSPDVLTDVSGSTEKPQQRFNGEELAKRLGSLVSAQRPAFSFDALAAYMDAVGLSISKGTWAALLAGRREVRASEDVLSSVADYFEVDSRYLLSTRLDEETDRVNAQVDVELALREAGATAVSGRALGSLSPDVLRHIAQAIRDTSDSGE